MFKEGHHIITGEVDSGKSSHLQELFLSLKGERKISGWISLPFYEGSKKTGYDILFIRESVEEGPRRFIRTCEFDCATRWKRFFFDEQVFVDAVEKDFGRPDIFVIDEVGPLELFEQRGFWPIMETVYSKYKTTITVCRNTLLDDFQRRFDELNFFIVHT